jgi:hypothetical protein
MVVSIDFRNLTISNINAITSWGFVDQISNGKFIATIEYIEDLDGFAEKSVGVFPNHIKVRFSALDCPKRARMNKVLSELKFGNILVAKCIKPCLSYLSIHKNPPAECTHRKNNPNELRPLARRFAL